MSRLGKPAAQFALADTTGRVHHLTDYAGRWLHLVFLRHLGCPSCRAYLADLRGRQAEIAALGIDVLAITFEAAEYARRYREETKIPWPLVIDEDRTLYHAYGMTSGSLNQLYGPRSIWHYLKIVLRGTRVRWPTGDTSQLGGDVLVDPQGIVRFEHVASPAGRPTFETLTAAMHPQGLSAGSADMSEA
jgi:peroxiredoxin